MEVALSHLTAENFEQIALEIFRYQAKHNAVYRQYLTFLNVHLSSINNIEQIPFLPISLFKNHKVLVEGNRTEKIFYSSGTTASVRSEHHIASLKKYRESFVSGFQYFYGNPQSFCIIGLLPSYLENESSSLIYMVDELMKMSKYEESGYLLGKKVEFVQTLKKLQAKQVPTMVIGVSYALLDMAEVVEEDFAGIVFMETGGMKGRRKELTREELHHQLKSSFGVSEIHAEYGMTELLSQAYAKERGLFACPPWMKVLSRPINQPFDNHPFGEAGVLKIIDLANIHSCSFIETADLGKVHQDGRFEVIGRLDHSDLRGCNLLIVD